MRRGTSILSRQLRATEFIAAKPCPRKWTALPLQTLRFNSTETSSSSSAPPPPAASKSKEAETKKAEDEAVEALEKQLASRDSEIAKLKNALLEEVANFSNLQKNANKEKATAREFAISKFAGDLVSNLDVLQMALDAVPEEKRSGQGEIQVTKEDLANLWKGVDMTLKELESTLRRYGVTPFDPVGEKFDPNRHEALYQVPMPDKEPNTVFQCSQKGWMIKNRLLRPAQVGVVQSTS